jgi:hypothetical protein
MLQKSYGLLIATNLPFKAEALGIGLSSRGVGIFRPQVLKMPVKYQGFSCKVAEEP